MPPYLFYHSCVSSLSPISFASHAASAGRFLIDGFVPFWKTMAEFRLREHLLITLASVLSSEASLVDLLGRYQIR